MNRIKPFLWYDKSAREARDFYSGVFGQINEKEPVGIEGSPSGNAELIDMNLFGQAFQLLAGGPFFRFNPSISFLVNCGEEGEVRAYWERMEGGSNILMPLGAYPFSAQYGWLEDKYGLSWQFYASGVPFKQKIVPTLMFVGDNCGKAEEAVNFYARVFSEAKVNGIVRYDGSEAPNAEGSVKHIDFVLETMAFAAMDSALEHKFTFNEAVSFVVGCKTQEEIDYFWGKLSSHPEAEQCGWLKDKYGVSWQIVPEILAEMMRNGTERQRRNVTESFLKMKKFTIKTLREAYRE